MRCSAVRHRSSPWPGGRAPGCAIRPGHVPAPIRDLIPLAMRWGILDDEIRGCALAGATVEELVQLRTAISADHEEALDTWLGDSDRARVDGVSAARVAFSLLRLASYEARSIPEQ